MSNLDSRTITRIILVLAGLIAVMAVAPAHSQEHPLINEVMSSNTGMLADEDGDRVDWIELYNPGAAAVNLDGFGLSDDPGELFRWVFPAIELNAGGYLVVFASGKDRADAGADRLHTDFGIDRDGEALYLTASGGMVVDEVDVPALANDTSWGRSSDGAPDWQEFIPATPGVANEELFPAALVTISHSTGFYSDPITITLSTETTGATIHYTLDSSEPTPQSPVYATPLIISDTTVLRARAVGDQLIPGPVTTVSYCFEVHPETAVPEYFITCVSSDFDHIYAEYEDDIYIPVTVTSDGVTLQDVRMRIRGDDSRAFPKKSLKLRFDGDPFANGREVLNFNAEYLDKSYLNQFLSSYVMRAAGYPALTAGHARLYLNGSFLGLYLSIENVDESFLMARGMDPEGNLYKATHENANLSRYDVPDSLWEKKTNEQSGFSDLIAFVDSINAVPDSDYVRFTQERIDYERMVDILALNMLVANGSTYYHNYFMYHDINGSGKWSMLPWDLDKTMGLNYGFELAYHRSSPSRRPDNPFLDRAILIEPILEDIIGRVDELSDTVFNMDTLGPVIDSLTAAIASSVEQDITDDVSGNGEWLDAVGERTGFIGERSANLAHQFGNLPRPFRVERTPDIMVTNTPFIWHPASDPNGDPVTYTFTLSDTYDFTRTVVSKDDITDTTFTLPAMPSPGTYYWRVSASDGTPSTQWYDGSNRQEGFESWNRITVRDEGSIPESITSDMTLSVQESPYLVRQDIIVAAGATLTIPAGVELRFMPAVQMTVRGRLEVCGTDTDPTVFRSSGPNERWGTILFESAEGTSFIEHVVISGASESDGRHAAITSIASSLELRRVVFDNNLSCLNVQNGAITVEQCRFEASNREEQLNINGADVVIADSYFHMSGEGDAIDVDNVHDCEITGNMIAASGDDGIDIGEGSQRVRVYGNRVFNCSDKGISVGEQSREIVLERNSIAASGIGIAVKDGSNVFVRHQTLYGNTIAIAAYHDTAATPAGGVVDIVNTIIAGSINDVISTDSLSEITVSYSLIELETLPGIGNITGSPGFLAPLAFDFTLVSGSPAIDTGDPASSRDPDGSLPDMGAYWFTATGASVVINEINYHSAATFDTGDWFELHNPTLQPVDLAGWTVRDSNVSNSYRIPEGTIISSGGYVVLASDRGAFMMLHSGVPVIGDIGFNISNGGESVSLYNGSGIVVDTVTFSDDAPWPPEPDGGGATLALIDSYRDNDEPGNWFAAGGHGTPGRANDETTHVSQSAHPATFIIHQNYPNPFNPATTISYTLPSASTVALTVYSITGQRVDRFDLGMQQAGLHEFVFDGSGLSSGVYLYRIEADRMVATRRMLLMR